MSDLITDQGLHLICVRHTDGDVITRMYCMTDNGIYTFCSKPTSVNCWESSELQMIFAYGSNKVSKTFSLMRQFNILADVLIKSQMNIPLSGLSVKYKATAGSQLAQLA